MQQRLSAMPSVYTGRTKDCVVKVFSVATFLYLQSVMPRLLRAIENNTAA